MADELPDVVERFVADVSSYVRDLERAAREADHFGDQNEEARNQVARFGHQAEEAAERAARAQAEAAREAEKLARGEGDVERAARAAARAQRELERAEIAQTRAARAASQQIDEEAEQYRQLAREAARAAAAQRLAQMRASGQFREHNELLRRLREEYGDFGDESDHVFREMESRARATFNGLRESGVSNFSAMKAALLLLPVAAAVAAGAVTFVLGGAIAGIGIMAAAQNAEVKASYTDLKKHVVSELKGWATPFQATLLEISDIGRETFDAFGPDLRDVFAQLAPAVTGFADDTADAFLQFRPVIRDFADGFEAILNDLGPRMPVIVGNLATALDELAQAAEENPEQFGQLLQDVSELAKFAGQLSGVLSSLSGGFHDVSGAAGAVTGVLGPLEPLLSMLAKSFLAASNPLSAFANGFRQVKQGFDNAGASINGFRDKTLVMNGVLAATATNTDQANSAQTRSGTLMQLASQAADKLKASLDALAGKELSAREAAAQYGQSVLAMTKSLKDNGKAHGFNTAKGIQNEQALTSMAKAAQANAVAMRDNGKGAKEVARFMEGARKKFVEAAVAAGYNRGEANKLADELYGVKRAADKIPKKKHVKVTAETGQAKAETNGFLSWVGRQVGRIRISALWGHAEGGLVGGYATGGQVSRVGPGMVRGPGTGTSDSILARLSNNEFVMTAQATRRFGPLLAMMNKAAKSTVTASGVRAGQDIRRERGIPRGGVGAIEDGRYETVPAKPKLFAQLPRAAAPASITYVTHQHYNIAGSVWAEKELFDVVQRQAGGNNVRNPGLKQLGGR